MYKTDLTSL